MNRNRSPQTNLWYYYWDACMHTWWQSMDCSGEGVACAPKPLMWQGFDTKDLQSPICDLIVLKKHVWSWLKWELMKDHSGFENTFQFFNSNSIFTMQSHTARWPCLERRIGAKETTASCTSNPHLLHDCRLIFLQYHGIYNERDTILCIVSSPETIKSNCL